MKPDPVRVADNGWPVSPFLFTERLVTAWLDDDQRERALLGEPATEAERLAFLARVQAAKR